MLVFVDSCLVLAIVVVVFVQSRLLVMTHVDDFVAIHPSSSRTSMSDRVLLLPSMFPFPGPDRPFIDPLFADSHTNPFLPSTYRPGPFPDFPFPFVTGEIFAFIACIEFAFAGSESSLLVQYSITLCRNVVQSLTPSPSIASRRSPGSPRISVAYFTRGSTT